MQDAQESEITQSNLASTDGVEDTHELSTTPKLLPGKTVWHVLEKLAIFHRYKTLPSRWKATLGLTTHLAPRGTKGSYTALRNLFPTRFWPSSLEPGMMTETLFL